MNYGIWLSWDTSVSCRPETQVLYGLYTASLLTRCTSPNRQPVSVTTAVAFICVTVQIKFILSIFTPFQVSLSAVAIGVTHCEVAPTHILYAANASLVGLCCLDEKVVGRGGPMLLSQTPICPCVGLGK